MSSSSRIPSLDGLRALSISFVLVGHFAFSSGFPIQRSWWTDIYAHYGVRIFFVISGFLITTLLVQERQKTGRIDLKQFYIRRAYRIFPAAYFYLLVVTVVFYSSLSFKYLIAAYTYMTSYAIHSPWNLRHLWSLSVEEQFYMLWPALIAIGLVVAPRIAFGSLIFAPVLRLVLVKIGPPYGAPSVIDSIFPCVIDSLAAGCLLALYQEKFRKYGSFFAWRGFPIIWVLTLSVPILQHYHYVLNFWHVSGLVQSSALTIFNLGIVLCIQHAITTRPRILNTTVMIWIGNLSYSLYLWNMPFTNPDSRTWFTAFPLNLVLTLLAATVSFYVVEQPIRNLRQRRARAMVPPRPPVSTREKVEDLVEVG